MKILLMGYLTDLRKHAISYAEIKKFKVQNIVFKVGTYLRIQHKLTMTDRLIVTWGYNLSVYVLVFRLHLSMLVTNHHVYVET